MSLFDRVICEVDLPDGWTPPRRLFQSKDFGSMMLTHTITRDGRLMIQHPIGDDVYQTEALGFTGRFRFYAHEVVPVSDVTDGGEITISKEGNRRRYIEHRYEACFNDGRLVTIVVVMD